MRTYFVHSLLHPTETLFRSIKAKLLELGWVEGDMPHLNYPSWRSLVYRPAELNDQSKSPVSIVAPSNSPTSYSLEADLPETRTSTRDPEGVQTGSREGRPT